MAGPSCCSHCCCRYCCQVRGAAGPIHDTSCQRHLHTQPHKEQAMDTSQPVQAAVVSIANREPSNTEPCTRQKAAKRLSGITAADCLPSRPEAKSGKPGAANTAALITAPDTSVSPPCLSSITGSSCCCTRLTISPSRPHTPSEPSDAPVTKRVAVLLWTVCMAVTAPP